MPPGLRLVFGLLLIIGGIFGFLPILGFWMIPLGIGVAALDVMPLYRRLRGKRVTRKPQRLVLAPLPREDIAKVGHLTLPEAQTDFVGTISEMTNEPDLLQDFHYARDGENVVGFFKIDRDFSRTVTRLPEGTHGFRGLLIGAQFQGKGFGHALLAELPVYVARHYPISDLWLAVDAENSHAIELYKRHGWVVDGPQRKGRIAMEDVMRLPISADCPSSRAG
ncbi:MAG: GNAT family N-acetyltransferase [Pseudomonadota bacterium]